MDTVSINGRPGNISIMYLVFLTRQVSVVSGGYGQSADMAEEGLKEK